MSLRRAAWAEQAFNDMMIDSLWDYHQRQGSALTREDVAQQFVQREDWSANILAPLEDQCQWLREIGYVDVDCFFKAFELAIFGGRKRTAVESPRAGPHGASSRGSRFGISMRPHTRQPPRRSPRWKPSLEIRTTHATHAIVAVEPVCTDGSHTVITAAVLARSWPALLLAAT